MPPKSTGAAPFPPPPPPPLPEERQQAPVGTQKGRTVAANPQASPTTSVARTRPAQSPVTSRPVLERQASISEEKGESVKEPRSAVYEEKAGSVKDRMAALAAKGFGVPDGQAAKAAKTPPPVPQRAPDTPLSTEEAAPAKKKAPPIPKRAPTTQLSTAQAAPAQQPATPAAQTAPPAAEPAQPQQAKAAPEHKGNFLTGIFNRITGKGRTESAAQPQADSATLPFAREANPLKDTIARLEQVHSGLGNDINTLQFAQKSSRNGKQKRELAKAISTLQKAEKKIEKALLASADIKQGIPPQKLAKMEQHNLQLANLVTDTLTPLKGSVSGLQFAVLRSDDRAVDARETDTLAGQMQPQLERLRQELNTLQEQFSTAENAEDLQDLIDTLAKIEAQNAPETTGTIRMTEERVAASIQDINSGIQTLTLPEGATRPQRMIIVVQ